MDKPKPEDIWLIRELANLGYLNGEQVRHVLEQLKAAIRNETQINLNTLLVEEKLIKQEVLQQVLKNQPKEIINSQEDLPAGTVHSPSEAFRVEEFFKNISDFEYQRLLGNGNIGDSYLVDNKDFESSVIKLMHPELASNTGYINSIKKNLQLIDFKNHPNLAVHDIQYAPNGQIYFVSKYLPYDSIGVFIKNTGRLEINSALEVLKKICEVMKFFERIKCPYLGLHPDNIFRQPSGAIVLKDFEWNRRYFNDQIIKQKIGPGISYMSPEYLKGQPVDHLSDIYAFGVLMYFVLTRKMPFYGNAEVQLEKKEKGEFTPMEDIHKDIPLHLGVLVKQLLEPNKENRLQSFDAILEFIEEAIRKRNAGDFGSKKPAANNQAPINSTTRRKLAPLTTNNDLENKTKARSEIAKNATITLVVLAVVGIVAFVVLDFLASSNQSKASSVKNNKSKIENNKKIDKPKPIADSNKENTDATEDEPDLVKKQEIIVEVNTIEKPSDTKPFTSDYEKFKQLLANKINEKTEEKKFSRRSDAIKALQDDLKNTNDISHDQLRRLVASEINKVEQERQKYWDIQKSKLKKLYDEKNETGANDLIKAIGVETDNDEFIQNKIFALRVTLQKLDPEESKKLLLDSDSLMLKEVTEKAAQPLIENHDYNKLTELFTQAMKSEKNSFQKQIYADQVEFYDHAEKIKNYLLNVTIKPNLLLRNLYIDEDGALEAVSSRGFHVNDGQNKIIPWKNITMRTISALVAKYEPANLGECISLLIYASRASNHIAMQKAIRSIEIKYSASMNSPLVKESKEKLDEMKNILAEEDIRLQISMIKTLKMRNTPRAKKDAEFLIKDLRDEYLSSPIYKKFESEIIDLTAALSQSK